MFQGGFTDGWVARVGPGADLGVQKSANRTTAEQGAQIIYTITVSNSGPDAATDVTLIDTLPVSVTFQSCTANSGGVCSNIGNGVTVHFDTLPLNNSATITIVARVNLADEPGHGDRQRRVAADRFRRPEPGQQHVVEHRDGRTGPGGDTDTDGLPNGWEASTASIRRPAMPAPIPDGDGRTNLQEYQQGTHPRGFVITYFAEGATGAFFDTAIAVANPTATRALVLTRFQRDDGAVVRKYQVVEPHSRATIVVEQVPGMASAAFSTLIEADVQVVADRTMSWDNTGYGGHAERGTLTRATSTWYLAEGATHGSFDLFYLIQNPGDVATTVEVKFLRLAPKAPVIKQYSSGRRHDSRSPSTRCPSSRPRKCPRSCDPSMARRSSSSGRCMRACRGRRSPPATTAPA